MKPGTQIRLPDGREGTIVFNGLSGYGIRWGRLDLSAGQIEAIYSGDGNAMNSEVPDNFELEPQAMLRDHYSTATLECVGSEFDIIEQEE